MAEVVISYRKLPGIAVAVLADGKRIGVISKRGNLYSLVHDWTLRVYEGDREYVLTVAYAIANDCLAVSIKDADPWAGVGGAYRIHHSISGCGMDDCSGDCSVG